MLKRNINSWIIFNIAIIALITDFFCYFVKTNYLISLITSLACIIICNIFLIKNKKIKISLDFNILDICIIIYVIVKIINRISIPNYFYDVANYHIYLQENPFIDKINFDFFAGKSVNGFLFPLGDRMFYIFRYLLGYRLGTILSFYCLIVLYYQIKNLISYFVNSNNKDYLICIFSFFSSICLVQLNHFLGSYYIDIFSTVFILETISFLITLKDNINRSKLIYLCLLIGIATAIKLPNLLLIMPSLIYLYFIKNIKINRNDYLIFLLILVPIIPYTLDNFLQTGSPIFPYYNDFFKSKYFALYSWKDPAFGINNIFYGIIWPIYTSTIKLGYGDGARFFDPIWAIGYIVVIFFIIFNYKKNNNLIKFCILALIITFIWELLLEGYMRYAFIVPILYEIIISIIVIQKTKFTDNELVRNISLITITLTIIINSISNANFYIFDNYKYLFKDRNIKKIKIDGVWGTIGDDSGITVLVREKNTPIYNLNREFTVTNTLTKNMYYEKINNKNIYILVDPKYKLKDEILKINGFEVDKLVNKYNSDDISCLSVGHTLYLYKIKYVGVDNEK